MKFYLKLTTSALVAGALIFGYNEYAKLDRNAQNARSCANIERKKFTASLTFADYNATHQLQFEYTPDKVIISNHTIERSPWQVSLEVKGIYKGRTLLSSPHSNPEVIFDEDGFTYQFGKFDIQYQNTDAGMRQNFIVHDKPNGDEPLNVRLQIDSKQLQLLSNSGSVRGISSEGNVYQYNDLKVWDSEQKPLPAHMEFNDGELALIVDDRDAIYPVTIDPISTNPDVVLEGNQLASKFGYSTANAGDVNGDGYDDMIVGAYDYDNGTTNEGGVFVYHGSATGLSATPAVVLESGLGSIRFGFSASGAGDVNNDGYDDVIVGAMNLSNGQSFEGRAYIYHGSASGVNPSPALTVESNLANAYLGVSVASAGDINNDGYDDVVIGAKGYTNGQTNEGALYVYRGSATGISTATLVKIEPNVVNVNLGSKVSAAGDVNGDGYDDIISGTQYYSNGQSSEGGAFIYHGSAAGITTTPARSLESNQIGGAMGSAVACAGDVNADGYDDIAIGAYTYTNDQDDEGTVYIYHGSATGIPATAAIVLESNQALAGFGVSVSGAGDLNNDGYSDIVVGANLFDNPLTDEGKVFIYHGSATGLSAAAVVTTESNQASSDFGFSVGGGGDVNGDGYDDIIIGSSQYDADIVGEGAAFVHYGNNCTPSTFYYDGDSDGFGINTISVQSCSLPPGYATNALDCNDVNALYNPNSIWRVDNDDDGYYDETVPPVIQCSSPGLNYLLQMYYIPGDCNDADYYASPIQDETLDGVDNDCNGYIDEDMHFIIDTVISQNVISQRFGYDIAAAGDLNNDGYDDIVVGAYNYAGDGSIPGAIMILHGSSNGIDPTPIQIIAGTDANGGYGCSLDASGDMNNDGYKDLIVGAELAEELGAISNYGNIYMHLGQPDGTFIEGYTVSYEVGGSGGTNFGAKVRYAGDVNGDGYDDILAAIRNRSNGQFNEGGFHMRYGDADGFGGSAIIESNQVNAQLGWSVDGAGDVNGDGYDDVCATAKFYDNGQTDEGAVFVYYGSASGIPLTASIILEANQASANMSAVSAAGDINGDGYDDIIAGALGYDGGVATNEGRVFVYYGSATGLSTTPGTFISGIAGTTGLGENVEGIGDVNGDGYADVAVTGTVPVSDHIVYIYLGSATGLLTTPYSIMQGQWTNSLFGNAITGTGDNNGDGALDFMIGAPKNPTTTFEDGAVFAYYGLCGNVYYADADGDGYGNPAVSITGCSAPIGYVTNNLDCNDANNAIKPGASEICNSIDDDCDASIDEGVIVTITISAGGSTVFCQGSSVVLSATHTGATLQWKKNGSNIAGATGSTYTVTTTGAYTCVSSNACATATSAAINVTVNKNPNASISAGGATTFCAGGSVTLTEVPVAGCTYQWYKGAAPIAGATATTYVATTAGSYKCRVTKTATGCFKNSNAISVSVPCKEGDEISDEAIQIAVYPNPANDAVTLVMDQNLTTEIFVTNVIGETIMKLQGDSELIEMDIHQLASGVYFVHVVQNGKMQTVSFCKN